MPKQKKKTSKSNNFQIGERIRSLRAKKGLSQGDIERGAGMLRCYISRVENGHTIPSLETVERFAAALDVPLYELFYPGDGSVSAPNLLENKNLDEVEEKLKEPPEELRFLAALKKSLAQVGDADRKMFLAFARKLAGR